MAPTAQKAPESRPAEDPQRSPPQSASAEQGQEAKRRTPAPHSHTLKVPLLSEKVLQWVRLAIGLGLRERHPRADAPPASFDAMLAAAHFVDDPDAQWLATQLERESTPAGANDADARATAPPRESPMRAYEARFDAARIQPAELLAGAQGEVLPRISRSTEAWLEEALRLAFGHRPDARVTPAEVVAAFVSHRGTGGHEAAYEQLAVQGKALADAFVAHARTTNPDFALTFEHLMGGRERIPLDELKPLISRFTPEVFGCFEGARAETTAPDLFLGELMGRLASRLDLAGVAKHRPAPSKAHGAAAENEAKTKDQGVVALGELPLEIGAWIESARALAAAAGSERIDTHHLVAVALRRALGGDRLLHREMNPAAMKGAVAQLIERIGATRGDEAPAIWDYFEHRAPVPPVAPGFRSDVTDGVDRLNFEADAQAVALLAAAPGVPPLSIGVFGEWGTGKSFFLRRVKKYAAADDVLQIEFNAWNYTEGNLFASIAHRVFTALRGRMGAPGTNPLDDALPAALRSEAARTAARTAADKRAALEAQVKARQGKVDDQRSKPRDLGEAILDVAATPPGDPETMDAAAKEKAEQAKAKLRAQVADGWKLARQNVLRWRVMVPLLATTALVVGLIVGVPALRTWGVYVWALGATVASWGAVVGKYVKVAAGHIGTAKDRIAALDDALRDSKRRNDPELRRLTGELSEAIVSETDATARAAAADQDLAKHLEQVKSSAPMERLDALVRDRFESGTYRKMLGIVEQVRGDLETLSVLLVPDHDAQRRRELLEKYHLAEDTLPQLRRIILYIDDLDRCPSDRVAEVLQAVHLLLAYPLFVVLVAIDPRWGIASLERSFDQLAPSAGRAITSATGFDYLEKIFQIPLWVRTMSSGDAARLLGDYLPIGPSGSGEAPANGTPAATARGVDAAGVASTTSGAGGPSGAASVPAGSASPGAITEPAGAITEPAGASGLDRVAVSLEELNYAEWLAGSLGSSPRRVKRFANLYRLVKAMLSGPEWHEFDLEDARACLTLLAIQTGAPSVAPEILCDLITGAGVNEATDLLGLPALHAPRSPRLEPADLDRAKQIVRIYAGRVPADPRRRLEQWAPRISRLSFRREAVDLAVAPDTAQL